MSLEDEVVAAARRWIGTPYVHQASCCNGGADCLGLIRGIWRELFGEEPTRVPAYTPDWSEPAGDEVLFRSAENHLQRKPVDQLIAGNVILFRMRNGSVAKHLGVVAGTEPATFIHAYSGHGVIESPLSNPWRRKIVACFEFPTRRN